MDGNLTYLDSDPLCKCAQKLSQVSFGCTFLFGSTVVMINLIMFVHLSFEVHTHSRKIQLSLHDAEMRASWVLINVLQVWRKNPRISVWRHIKEYEPELRWSNFHLDFLFDAKEFLNCSLLSNAFVGLLEMVHTGELRDKVALPLNH